MPCLRVRPRLHERRRPDPGAPLQQFRPRAGDPRQSGAGCGHHPVLRDGGRDPHGHHRLRGITGSPGAGRPPPPFRRFLTSARSWNIGASWVQSAVCTSPKSGSAATTVTRSTKWRTASPSVPAETAKWAKTTTGTAKTGARKTASPIRTAPLLQRLTYGQCAGPLGFVTQFYPGLRRST